jgi:hypothetical protein
MKWDSILQKIAGDIVGFVDDLQASAFSVEEAWQVARQVVARLQYLGIQDAPRKRRPPSMTPGAWAGGVFTTNVGKVTKSVSQEKWDKGRRLVEELIDESGLDPDYYFDYKRLEQIRGFLCHLCMTFETFTPFLKGFHLTLSSYLPHRDDEGWKMSDKQWEQRIATLVERGSLSATEAAEMLEEDQLGKAAEMEWSAYLRMEVESGDLTEEDYEAATDRGKAPAMKPPKKVKGVLRFFQDLKALQELLSLKSPPQVSVRAWHILFIIYGFADASGRGFGRARC